MRAPNYTAEEQLKFCKDLSASFGNVDIITNKQVTEFIKQNDLPYPHFLTTDKWRATGWGKYKLFRKDEGASNDVLTSTDLVFVPAKLETYVPFGFFADLVTIFKSGKFYPVYFTGETGNGKTEMVMQAAAEAGREVIRCNITRDTDELDLIGSHELINGETVYRDGPVIIAMQRGAILLLDEVDYGSERILCLNPVLEGKPYYNKKTGIMVYPAPGFTTVACANTKGKGSVDGKYIGANILNEAFLERFPITIEQEYPILSTEKKILEKNLKELEILTDENRSFITHLVKWAENVRKLYVDGEISDMITTRRLIHIVATFKIFPDRLKAIRLCLNRFEEETKTSMIDFYTKIDDDANVKSPKTGKKEPEPSNGSDAKYADMAKKFSDEYKKPVVIKDVVDNGVHKILVECENERNYLDMSLFDPKKQKLEDALRKIAEHNMFNW